MAFHGKRKNLTVDGELQTRPSRLKLIAYQINQWQQAIMGNVERGTIVLANAIETFEVGKKLGHKLPPGQVLLLKGNLGAGKTTFVQGLAKGMGITGEVVSPTFVLLSEYPEGRVPLYHFDLYRLETPDAVAALQVELYWEGLEVEPGILAIEWAERLPYLPPNYVELTFLIPPVSDTNENPEGRSLTWCAVGVGETAMEFLQGLST